MPVSSQPPRQCWHQGMAGAWEAARRSLIFKPAGGAANGEVSRNIPYRLPGFRSVMVPFFLSLEMHCNVALEKSFDSLAGPQTSGCSFSILATDSSSCFLRCHTGLSRWMLWEDATIYRRPNSLSILSTVLPYLLRARMTAPGIWSYGRLLSYLMPAMIKWMHSN